MVALAEEYLKKGGEISPVWKNFTEKAREGVRARRLFSLPERLEKRRTPEEQATLAISMAKRGGALQRASRFSSSAREVGVRIEGGGTSSAQRRRALEDIYGRPNLRRTI
ncbi:hypothetical protein D6792_03075 [Candidatus Parcubacteria bacterium]|nr:MAG: hypothetical protein D6792_03075 [Candidatus Parcubacteria bacterium]GIW68778.1 MAG: hypothetical protein KatS3mg100_272 [Candidatus Parcubacteria bacterium]